MAEIEGLVRALGEDDDAAKAAAAHALGTLLGWHVDEDDANRALIVRAGGIPPLVELLRDGSAKGKAEAAKILAYLAVRNANVVAIAEIGGVPPLVDLLRDGTAAAKHFAAAALRNLARDNAANVVAIAEAGGIPLLVDLLRERTIAQYACARALRNLASNNDANAVAVAVALGLEALVQLARRGRVIIDGLEVDAALPAKRKAALVVAALLGDCVPDSVPREIRALIGPYL